MDVDHLHTIFPQWTKHELQTLMNSMSEDTLYKHLSEKPMSDELLAHHLSDLNDTDMQKVQDIQDIQPYTPNIQNIQDIQPYTPNIQMQTKNKKRFTIFKNELKKPLLE